MTRRFLSLEQSGGVVRLVLDRPPLNVLHRPMLEELSGALAEVREEPTAKVLLLTGEGQAFCAGVDVADHTAERVEGMIEEFHRIVVFLLGMEIPVVAAVNGAALGGGFELALASDMVLARAGVRLGQPEIRLGVFPPAAAALLPRLVGRQCALDLILSGRTITAEEALPLGLVARALAPEAFEREVEAYVAALAGLSRPVLRLAKRAVLQGLDRPLDEALAGADRIYLDDLMSLRDPHEGLAAFMERREPVWSDA